MFPSERSTNVISVPLFGKLGVQNSLQDCGIKIAITIIAIFVNYINYAP